MKIPAVAIAAAFASGIVLGRVPNVAAHAARQSFLLAAFVIVAALLCLAVVLCRRDFLALAAITSLLGWAGLGLLAGWLTEQPLAPEHILSRIAADQVPLRTPLRWNGTLRDEVSRLPWGYGLDINLVSVEMAEGTVPVTGGMRIGYTPGEGDPPLPDVHAGDEISIFAEGRLPLVYKDPGAFDRRDFLARQNFHLLATLRSSKLLEKTAEAWAPLPP